MTQVNAASPFWAILFGKRGPYDWVVRLEGAETWCYKLPMGTQYFGNLKPLRCCRKCRILRLCRRNRRDSLSAPYPGDRDTLVRDHCYGRGITIDIVLNKVAITQTFIDIVEPCLARPLLRFRLVSTSTARNMLSANNFHVVVCDWSISSSLVFGARWFG